MYGLITLGLIAITTAVHGREPPIICMLSPLATVTAGQPLSATVVNPQGRPCGATLVFSDPNFLPVTFDLEPTLCLGYQRAEVLIPMEVPNGEVTVLWECAGDSGTCSRALIEGGTADAKNLERQQSGTIECVVPTATITTLLTSVQDTTTITTAVFETLFSTNPPILLATKSGDDAATASETPSSEESAGESLVEGLTATASKTRESARENPVESSTATGVAASTTPGAQESAASIDSNTSGMTPYATVVTMVMQTETPTPEDRAEPISVSDGGSATTAWSEPSACSCSKTPTESV